MELSEAQMVLGLSDGFTESDIWASYRALWDSIEPKKFFATRETAFKINESLGRLNVAKSTLLDTLATGPGVGFSSDDI